MDYVDALEFFLEGLKGHKMLKPNPKDYGVVVYFSKYRVLKERKKRKRAKTHLFFMENVIK